MTIRILTDSASDFDAQALRAHNIIVVPMHIHFGEEAFLDGVTLSGERFWQRMLAGETPKTSQPSPDAFLTEFEQAKAAGDAVICVLISSALSGTLQSAAIARSMIDYEPIYVIDSLTAAGAQMEAVLYACRLRDEGTHTPAQIAEKVEAVCRRIRLYASLDTLEYLARGGRIPKTAANLGALVQLKPLITLSEAGSVSVAGKGIGRHRACDALVKLIAQHPIDPDFPVLPICSYRADNCKVLVKKLNAQGIACREEDIIPIGTTISTHIGPDAYGLVFVEAEKQS